MSISTTTLARPIVGTGGVLTTVGYLNVRVDWRRPAEAKRTLDERTVFARMASAIMKFVNRLIG